MEHHPDCTTTELHDHQLVFLYCHDECEVLKKIMEQSLKDLKETSVYSRLAHPVET